MPVNDLIQLRKGTGAVWSSINPVLATGEPGYDLTNNILKVGDGTNAWADIISPATSEVYVYAKNATTGELTKGQAVYIDGAGGNNPTIALSVASGELTSSKTIGLLKQNLAVNEFGYIITAGILDNVNTNGSSDGDPIWLSPTTPGGLVYGSANKPLAPNHLVFLGYVLRAQLNNGKIFVKVQNGFELEELHNVAVTGVTNGQFLQYNSSSGLWIPSSSGNFTTLQVNETLVPTGVGSAGHITYWNNANSLSYDNGQLYWDSINNRLGIGTTTPTANLHVNGGGAKVDGALYIESGNFYFNTFQNDQSVFILGQNDVWLFYSDAANDRIGIGSYPPAYKLDVSGTVGFSSTVSVPNIGTGVDNSVVVLDSTGKLRTDEIDSRVWGSSLIDGAGTANYIPKWTDADTIGNSILYDSGTNIGIGTNSPSYKLDVVGTGNFSQNLLVNGTGVSLSGHTHSSSQITDFNSSVSGLLPVKDIIAGTGIIISANNGNYTINSSSSGGSVSAEDVMDIIGTGIVAGTGISINYNDSEGNLTINLYAIGITGYEILTTTKDTFTVTPNYLVGNLQVYYNGFKLLDGEDYTATNGTSFVLNAPGASGDVVEWAGLGGPAQYAQLNHTHTISDITNFGSGVTGLLPTIANSGNNRILTSTGSSTGINAESNFTFDGTSLSHHAGNFANAGDAQHTILVVRRTTTDSTADVVLTLDGNTPGASNRPTIPAQSVWTFSLKLSAYNDTDSLGAWWIIRGGIRRNGANGTALVGSLVVENDSEGAMSGTSATVVADDTNEALEIRVTGLSSKNIRWVGVLDISQVSYGTP